MRKKPNPFLQPVMISHNPKVHPTILTKQIRSLFPQPTHPLYVDLGTGRGQFLSKVAKKFPHINWIGIERKMRHLIEAKQKKESRRKNLVYFWTEVEQLAQIFQEGEVNRFYIQFCTPYENPYQMKKHLTHRKLLHLYRKLLTTDGDMVFKTDHFGLFQFTLQELQEANWEIIECSDNYHQSPWFQADLTTEWEDSMSQQGPIYYVRTQPKAAN